MSIIIALLVLSFLVFFHELGHFVVARMCGVKVEVFSIGFGKKLATFNYKNTQYALSLIPLGGYVKLKGQDDSNPKIAFEKQNLAHDSYLAKSPLQRIAILLAGPAFNILLAFLLYVVIGISGKLSLLPIVGAVQEGSPAHFARILPNDRILKIDDRAIKVWSDISEVIEKGGDEVLITLERKMPSGEIRELEVYIAPKEQEAQNIFKERIMKKIIGISAANVIGEVRYEGLSAFSYAYSETLKASTLIAQGIIKLFSGVVHHSEVGGVVSIVSIIGSASNEGLIMLFALTALISVNLGIINLLPIPALDGGHIVFNCYELVAKRPPSEKIAYILTLCGWGILAFLMLLGLYNDIFRLLG